MSLPSTPMKSLGRSGIQVSRLALGSWRTYDRISHDQGVRVMWAARDAGINFLDDARYNDETGKAPIPTGYSEVVFGELFRAGATRPEQVSANLGALAVADQLTQDERDRLARVGLRH